MPIEITELVVRVVVDQQPNARPPTSGEDWTVARDEIVQQCVDAVLTMLRDKRER